MPIMFKPRVRCMNSVARSNRSQVWEERPLRGQPAKNCFNRRVKADKGIFAGFIFPEEGGGVYVFPSGCSRMCGRCVLAWFAHRIPRFFSAPQPSAPVEEYVPSTTIIPFMLILP